MNQGLLSDKKEITGILFWIIGIFLIIWTSINPPAQGYPLPGNIISLAMLGMSFVFTGIAIYFSKQ